MKINKIAFLRKSNYIEWRRRKKCEEGEEQNREITINSKICAQI